MTLRQILTADGIPALAGPRYYERGERYFHENRVVRLTDEQETIWATVAGTEDYRVKLRFGDNGFHYTCDCPIGSRGEFCKHCVAVSLQWLHPDNEPAVGATHSRMAPSRPDIHTWLKDQDKRMLLELLADRAEMDDELRDTLEFKAAAADFSLPAHKKLVRQAVGQRQFTAYREMPAYSRRLHAVVDNFEELLTTGLAGPLIELCEYTLRRVEAAMGRLDDSDGYMQPILERLQGIHLAACRASRPDPIALATRLFAWELDGDWDTFFAAAETYADVLGEAGLGRYRELAETEWNRIPTLGPGDDDSDRHGRRFNITSIMEELARAGGNLDEWIEVKKKDLSSSYSFLRIAEVCLEAGDRSRALDWAQKGIAAFGETADHRLTELLAAIHDDNGDHATALALLWRLYVHRPHLAAYAKLKQSADPLRCWPEWRKRAFELVRGKIEDAARQRSPGVTRYSPWADGSLLVDILLWENDVNGAWREACDGGCSTTLWLRLAELREQEHPRDAIGVYQRLIPDIVNRTNNKAYAEAMKLVTRIGELMEKLRDRDAFITYLDALRAEFKRKRNFMRMLDTLSSPIPGS